MSTLTTLPLGALERVDVKKIWPKEASSFTPWLAENIAALGSALGLELELTVTEAACGDFSLDLLARDLNQDRVVVIENQLTQTDHDHLGKLLTYAASYDASAIVWIAPRFRDEHREALEWLNRRTEGQTNFFGVVVEALRIDGSRPAVNFRLVAMPNDWRKGPVPVGGPSPSPKAEAYRAFFQTLIDELREKHHFTNAKAGQPQNWYSFASGKSGVVYSASFGMGGKVRVELYIDFGDKSLNEALFDKLYAEKDAVEAEFGEELAWDRLEEKQACRVATYGVGRIDGSPQELVAVRSWMVERLLRLKKVFKSRVNASA